MIGTYEGLTLAAICMPLTDGCRLMQPTAKLDAQQLSNSLRGEDRASAADSCHEMCTLEQYVCLWPRSRNNGAWSQCKMSMRTSVDTGRSETSMVAEGFGHLQYLVSQLASGAEHDCSRPLWLALLPLLLLLPQLMHLQHLLTLSNSISEYRG